MLYKETLHALLIQFLYVDMILIKKKYLKCKTEMINIVHLLPASLEPHSHW